MIARQSAQPSRLRLPLVDGPRIVLDDERFCQTCFAGVDSAEHREKCGERSPRADVDEQPVYRINGLALALLLSTPVWVGAAVAVGYWIGAQQ